MRGVDLVVVLGSIAITGTANVRRTMLIQNGSHTLLLIVNEANVGPRKEITYVVELI
jgi:hypothetical protein